MELRLLIATVVRKSKVVPRQAEVALGVPGRLTPRIISTVTKKPALVTPDHLDVRHYKGGRSSAIRTAAFTPGEIHGTHFQRLSRPQGTWFCRKEETPPGIDPGTVRLVAQRLNH